MSAIVKFYVLQIKMKKMTLDDVPAKWREEVKDSVNGLYRQDSRK